MGGIVDSIFGGGDDGADAARDASRLQADYQREALEYLKERERLPRQYSEGALGILGGLFGLGAPGVPVGQDAQTAQQTIAGAPPKPTLSLEEFDPNSVPNYYETPAQRDMAVSRARSAVEERNARRRAQYESDLADWQSQYGPNSPAATEAAALAETGMSPQERALQAVMNNPLYQAALGDIGQQEEAILRNQSATGALRSAGTEQMLAENQRRRRLEALQTSIGSYQNMAGLQTYAPQIAQATAGIGQTLGQGMIGAAQSQQAANQAGASNLMGLGQLGLAAYGAGLFSDPRLKEEIAKIGEFDGFSIYAWTWNDKAKELGLHGVAVGPMADEVEAVYPDWVEVRQGYKFVTWGAA